MNKQNIIIAGSRSFTDYDYLEREIDSYFEKYTDHETQVTIISGTARGVDRLGELYAKTHNINLIRCPAEWKRFGRSAGPKRNEQMASLSTSDGCTGVLLAFWDRKSRGTYSMIELANKHGLKVHIIKV